MSEIVTNLDKVISEKEQELVVLSEKRKQSIANMSCDMIESLSKSIIHDSCESHHFVLPIECKDCLQKYSRLDIQWLPIDEANKSGAWARYGKVEIGFHG